MSEFRADVTVVGGGIAGLWSAKELIDQGLTVDVVERTESLANGPTTRNEGWLHAGTYHSVAVYDEEGARQVTERTVYGHDAILGFVPESVEHSPSFAIFAEEDLVQIALRKWDQFNIPHQEVSKGKFAADGLDTDRIKGAFAVRDRSVNSRVIVGRLADYILDNGGRIFTGAALTPTGGTTADVEIDGERHKFSSDAFLVTAGVGTKKVFEEITDTPFPMRYFKSHLSVVPRISQDNIFYMDPLEAGLMSHGGATIVGINREAVEVETPEYGVLFDKVRLVHDALHRMMPEVGRSALANALDVACVKADVADDVSRRRSVDTTQVLQDLNIKVFEPVEGWVCAIPGKMTEAPALARVAANRIMSREFSDSEHDGGTNHGHARPQVTLRPADRWLTRQP
ncbi:MAG TPA: FAD-dependent oxidoreductase [Candidatus Saccharimonadales bacterium]|nr:FAD-dependent oxidoreductase [Candidatus Saccharimonadales bacterium]